MLRFRIPEIALGALLATAFFALVLAFESSQQSDPSAQEQGSQNRQEETAKRQPNEDLWHWMTHDAAGFFTLWLVIVGGSQLVLFWVQLSLIRESLTDAKIAADAAKHGAIAARDSADTAKLSMVASDRAYVYHNGIGWISHRDTGQNRTFWRIRPMWINGGNTPTRRLRVFIGYVLRDTPLPDDYPFTPDPGVVFHPAAMAPKGGVIGSGTYDLWGDDLLAASRGTKFFYVWGIARYRDVFPNSVEHITKFCVQATNISGDPLIGFDEKTNPLEIIFAGYHRHNCADEDCEDQG
jgi:hypothetical protein